jgi:hypothetical protein
MFMYFITFIFFTILSLQLKTIFKKRIAEHIVAAIHCYGCILQYFVFGSTRESMMIWSYGYFIMDSYNAFKNRSIIFLIHHLIAISFGNEILKASPQDAQIMLRSYALAEWSNIFIYPTYIVLHSKYKESRFVKWIKIIHFCNYSYVRIFSIMANSYQLLTEINLTLPLLLPLVVYGMGIVWSCKLLMQLFQ